VSVFGASKPLEGAMFQLRHGRSGTQVSWIAASFAAHALLVSGGILALALWPGPPPLTPELLERIIFDPPPPPALPPQKYGASSGIQKTTRSPATKDAARENGAASVLLAPFEEPDPSEAKVATGENEGSALGSEHGADDGDAAGMDGGRADGVPGGVPDGEPGGVIGGTGKGPVPEPHPDRAPVLVRSPQPIYPREAFIRKVEGTVEIEIVIDAEGRVAHARLLRSVPGLDGAALQAVQNWLFLPALKGGRPVASFALIPVSFRIY